MSTPEELQQEVDRLLNENIRLIDENGTLRVLLITASHALMRPAQEMDTPIRGMLQ